MHGSYFSGAYGVCYCNFQEPLDGQFEEKACEEAMINVIRDENDEPCQVNIEFENEDWKAFEEKQKVFPEEASLDDLLDHVERLELVGPFLMALQNSRIGHGALIYECQGTCDNFVLPCSEGFFNRLRFVKRTSKGQS